MPTKRTRRTRRRTQGPGFDAGDIHSWIDFLHGGHPRNFRLGGLPALWSTWVEYLDAYCDIRSELLEQVGAGRAQPPYAERLLALLQGGVAVGDLQERMSGPYPDDDRYRWDLDGIEDAYAIASAPGAPDFVGTVRDWATSNEH